MTKIKEYISKYFFISQQIVDSFNRDNIVVFQFFQKVDDSILAGMNEVLNLLSSELKGKGVAIRYLPEGTKINSGDIVLELEGRYQDFGIYEGIIDGILARNTSIATNSYRCLKAAGKKEIICMSDRSDHYSLQKSDGMSMYVAGIRSFSSVAQAPNSNDCVVYGSIPHALIQNFEGDLIKAMEHYDTLFPEDDLVALVDFHNDVICDSLKVLGHFGSKLKGVRVDTSLSNIDNMFPSDSGEYGVTPNQIKNLRNALDENGGKHVKIYVSSGFNPEKIALFEKEKTPVDGYGVGEYLLKINNTFCGDAVRINKVDLAKKGRKYRVNSNLLEFLWE